MQAEPIDKAAQTASDPCTQRLLLGDCLALLPELADDSLDCIITDPPYGINYRSLSHSLPQTAIVNDGPEA